MRRHLAYAGYCFKDGCFAGLAIVAIHLAIIMAIRYSTTVLPMVTAAITTTIIGTVLIVRRSRRRQSRQKKTFPDMKRWTMQAAGITSLLIGMFGTQIVSSLVIYYTTGVNLSIRAADTSHITGFY